MATRNELYERIRKSSKDEVVLEEMIRLGFWPSELGPPRDTLEEVARRQELRQELEGLMAHEVQLQDVEVAKRLLHQRRLKESRERRKETRLRRLRERQERAESWRRR